MSTELIIKGKLIDSGNNLYIEHKILASFEEKIKIEGAAPIWQLREISAQVSQNGEFEFQPLKENLLKESISLKVLAPDGTKLFSNEYQISEFQQSIEINVDAVLSPGIQGGDPSLGQRKKIKGRVLDINAKRLVPNKLVQLWGKREGEENFEIRASTKTDKYGYFYADLPREDDYVEAFGVVGVGYRVEINIPLVDGKFPEKIPLIVEVPDEPEKEKEKECPCLIETPRFPDIDDLTNSPGTFSDDIGSGKCVDLTKPNRTIEEFSYYSVVRTTDPEIKGLTLSEPERLRIPVDVMKNLPFFTDPESELFKQYFNLKELLPPGLFTNPPGTPLSDEPLKTIPGDEPENILKVLNPSTIKSLLKDPDRFTPDKLMNSARWTAFQDMDRILNTFKKTTPGRGTLDVDNPVDWDDEPTFYQATTISHGHLLHFKQVWRADGYSLGDLLYSLPLAPCQKKQIAIIDWERREIARRSEQRDYEESLLHFLSRDRDVSEIVNAVLKESMRGGSKAKTGGFGLGIGIGIPGVGFLGIGGGGGSARSSAWQKSSREFSANTLNRLRDKTMQSASAVRSQRATVVQTVAQGESVQVQTEVVANHNHCHAITVEYFEVLKHLLVSQELADVQECLFIPLLMSRFDYAKALRWREPLSENLRDIKLRKGFDAVERIVNNYEGSDLPEDRYCDEDIEHLNGDLRISFHLARPQDGEDGEFADEYWEVYKPYLILVGLGIPTIKVWFWGLSNAKKERIFQERIAPRIAEAFVQTLKFAFKGASDISVSLDATLVSRYAPNTPLYVSLRPGGSLTAIKRASVEEFEISTDYDLSKYSKIILHSGTLRYRTKHTNNFLFRDARIMNDLIPDDPVIIPTILNQEELRNPKEEDKESARLLIDHLNDHLEYYHKVIWWNMDEDRRFMLLDGFIAPNSDGRSVASIVENNLIGIVGNCLIMPVARGFHLDPTYNWDDQTPDVDLLHVYAPTTPIAPMRISVPTPGVFAEAVMGSCNSCEEKDDTRFWHFEESPCGDEPTSIQPVSTETKKTEPGDLKPTDFPNSMISIQNAPNAPAPASAVDILKQLTNPNIFKDITGLEQTQKNAMDAMKSSLDVAKAFGMEAAKIEQQKALTKDVAKISKQIEEDKDLTPEQKKDLKYSLYQGMVGEDRKSEKKPTDVPEVKKVIDSLTKKTNASLEAIDGGQIIRASSSGPVQGFRLSFDIKDSVGEGGKNNAEDVYAVKKRLKDLGYDWINLNQTMDDDTIQVIKLFQAIKNGYHVVNKPQNDGLIEVGGSTHLWLQADNAPRWQLMPAGSRKEGFHNYELIEQTDDHHEYGTNWLAEVIQAAGKNYNESYLADNPNAALLTLNDVSLPRGGNTPDHDGHETGLACDLLLPKDDGSAGGITWNDDNYDRDAMRAMLTAIKSHELVTNIFFNDQLLKDQGLCTGLDNHDNHVHFEIKQPERGAPEMSEGDEFLTA